MTAPRERRCVWCGVRLHPGEAREAPAVRPAAWCCFDWPACVSRARALGAVAQPLAARVEAGA